MADLYEKSEYEEAGKKAFNAYSYLKKMFGFGTKEISDDEFQQLLIDTAKEYSQKTNELEDSKEKEVNQDINIENVPSVELNTAKNMENTNNIENVTNITNNKNINNNIAQEPIQEENTDFINDFLADAQESAKLLKPKTQTEAKLDNDMKANNANDENLNYFEMKSIELKTTKQTKEAFKAEFKQYASQKMNADELKVLVAILHKNPSRLNKEHKELIKESLALAQKNNTAYLHMDNAYKALIRTNLNQTISTQSVKDVIELFSSPKTELDKAVKKDSMSFAINAIKNLNKNSLAQETIAKLNNLVNPINKTLEIGKSLNK